MPTKKTTKKVEWDAQLDKRIADLKKEAKKNGNFQVFVVTTKKVEEGIQLSAVLVSKEVNLDAVLNSYLGQLPDGVLEAVLMRKMMNSLGER